MKNPLFARLIWAAPLLATLILASCQTSPEPIAQSTPAPLKVIDTIMVPGDDDLLHPKKVSRLALDTQLKSGGNAAPALSEIVKLAPQYFPKGTHIEDVKENGDEVTVLLSPEFGNAKHWMKGENMTQLAIYSLVNTLAKDGKKVTLTLEGKPISAIGEMAASEAFAADPTLNAPVKRTAPAPDTSSGSASASATSNVAPNAAASSGEEKAASPTATLSG